MGEFEKLISQGVYCEGCGCYTGQEPGHPVRCDRCKEGEENGPSSN